MAGDEKTMSLRVAKAIPSDVGHGRARISGENDLGLKPGDIVEIKGDKRSTAAIYWRSRPEDTKMEIIRVDGIIRKNAGVSLGDRVDRHQKSEAKECTKLAVITSDGQQAEGQVRARASKASLAEDSRSAQ